MIYGFIYGLLVYSFILTVVLLYKDDCYNTTKLDIIVSGPFAWIMYLMCHICRKVNKPIKNTVYTNKSDDYIYSVINTIVSNYTGDDNVLFDLTKQYEETSTIMNGWNVLIESNTSTNLIGSFVDIMLHQPQESFTYLEQYFTPVTIEYLQSQNYSTDDIVSILSNKNIIYRLKKAI